MLSRTEQNKDILHLKKNGIIGNFCRTCIIVSVEQGYSLMPLTSRMLYRALNNKFLYIVHTQK